MPLSTGIKTQRSAVVLLSGVTFAHNPNNIDGQQQVREGGTAVQATDSSTIYIKNDIVINFNADTWFDVSYNSGVAWIGDFDLVITNAASNSLVVPFNLYCNSNIDLQAGQDFGRFVNNSNFSDQAILTQVKIDTSSSLYVNTDIESLIKQDDNDIKGSLNNVFYGVDVPAGGGEPYVEINSTGPLPTASGTNHIAIGSGVITGGDGGSGTIVIGENALSGAADGNIVIGKNANGGDGGSGIAIGKDSSVDAINSLALGVSSLVEDEEGIAIGSNAKCYQGSIASIAIGKSANTNSEETIAIGNSATTSAFGAVQIGPGTNINQDSLQFQSNKIASIDGLFIEETSGTPPTVLQSGTPRWDANTGILYISNGTTWREIQSV